LVKWKRRPEAEFDILIKDDEGNVIIIENKIYAGEQHKQLSRYRNAFPEAQLFYLTLFGDFSVHEDSNVNYKTLSYQMDIIGWLEECRKVSVDIPIVRESISQYIFLLKKLTNQNANQKMSEEIINRVLGSPESLTAYKALLGIERDLKPELVKRILVEWVKRLKEEGFSNIKTFDFNSDRGMLISFQNPSLIQRNLVLELSFEGARYSNLIIGFRKMGASEYPNALFTGFQNKFGNAKSSMKYPAYMSYDPQYKDWHFNVLNQIYFNFDTFYSNFRSKAALILDIVNTSPQESAGISEK
jgi:hypothetical protein